MLKRFILFFALLNLFLNVQASVSLFEPVEETLADGASIALRHVQPGETIEFIIDRRSPALNWDSVEITSHWPVSHDVLDKTIEVTLSIPSDEIEGSKNISFSLKDSETGAESSFNAVVFVMPGLIEASLPKKTTETTAGSIAEFELVLKNNSLSSHEIIVKSTLPQTMFKEQVFELASNEIKQVKINVEAIAPGVRYFDFYVDSQLFEKRFDSLNAELRATPSLHSKFQASLTSSPIFSFSLFPSYILNALIAFLQAGS